jgi:aryl sulfotransferase
VIETIAGPTKTRELHNHHFDSTIWNDLRFRDDDIIISTYAKSGTTWMQQIVAQLLFGPDPEIEVAEMSPWLDLRVPPKEVKLPMVEAQTHLRFLKTHLPLDALVFSPEAKYIYVGRYGRDVVWSMYNHHANANGMWYEALNDTPACVVERPSSCLPAISGSTGESGWTATAIPSGHSRRTCAPGGSSATCRTSCSCTSRT